jgi:cytoskeleton protein RodZ
MTDPIESERNTLGRRLSETREARGLSSMQVAEQLHLPHSVVEALEAERFEQLGAPIYVRGHLRSYLRLLDLPEVLLEGALQQVGQAPPVLRTTTHTPHLKYLADRYAMRAVYMLLTLSIIVPALWVATQHAGLGSLQRSARSLDLPPTLPLAADTPEASAPDTTRSAIAEQGQGDRETVVASLAPFYPVAQPAEPEPTPAKADASGWLLKFTEDSWVEVLGREGQRLEYGLVRASSEREFAAGQVARIALGNAGGVEVLRAGESIDLAPYRRANVARFAVSSDGSLQASAD